VALSPTTVATVTFFGAILMKTWLIDASVLSPRRSWSQRLARVASLVPALRFLMQHLMSHLPSDRLQALIIGIDLPAEDMGNVLLADLSGFTPLTEHLLHQFGARRGGIRQKNRAPVPPSWRGNIEHG
jgi:hypothetical protein